MPPARMRDHRRAGIPAGEGDAPCRPAEAGVPRLRPRNLPALSGRRSRRPSHRRLGASAGAPPAGAWRPCIPEGAAGPGTPGRRTAPARPARHQSVFPMPPTSWGRLGWRTGLPAVPRAEGRPAGWNQDMPKGVDMRGWLSRLASLPRAVSGRGGKTRMRTDRDTGCVLRKRSQPWASRRLHYRSPQFLRSSRYDS